MAENRRIRQVVKSRSTVEGAGVRLHRAIGFGPPAQTDPFLLLDDFRSDDPKEYRRGFPWHPHRGIDTITYVLRGDVEHQDSLGNRGLIGAGDVQWMTAGSGIIHQEMPRGDARGALHGFQLWANLPAASKMIDPRYRGVAAAELPVAANPSGASIRVIAGSVGGVTGPVADVVTRPEYLDVTVPAGATFSHATARGRTVFAYVIGGRGVFCRQDDPYSYDAVADRYVDATRDRLIGDGNLVLFGEGDAVTVAAESEPVRFLLVSGRPIGEPIAWYGPIVMNTRDELRTAFQELEAGTFIKHEPGP
jgi:redox-sensitive bicupin YhaK (pirin superfamily)